MSSDQHDRSTAALEELHLRLRTAVEQLESGEQWQAWLQFARGFHRYSFNNLILIRAQRPDATAVASYRTWQAKGRQVRKGETALRVLAPILRRSPILDDHGRPVMGEDGKPRQRQQVCGFRPAPVFDLGQTDGPPIPEPARPELLAGAAPDGLWDALAREVSERGYRLRRGTLDDLHGANGLTNLTTREVWVRHDVDPAQAAKTLAHELGHILLHTHLDPGDTTTTSNDGSSADTDTDTAVEGWLSCAGIREVETESVAFLVTAAHGLHSDDYTFPYVATWAAGPAATNDVPIGDIITRTGTRVMRAAGQIIDTTLEPTSPEPVVAALAARAEITAEHRSELREQTSRAVATTTVDERRTLLGVVADSHLYFASRLGASWVPGYLAGRGLAPALEQVSVGYAPPGWTGLVDHLARLGYSDAQIEAAGMASRARTGRLVDRFRDRLILPVHDHHGELVGFVGRLGPAAVDDRYSPRYLNSPATSLFTKSDLVFGLGPHAKRIQDGWRPVLCEGPLDAVAVDIAAARTGARMVGVAACGTAFTPQHAARLTKLVGDQPICLALDADPAGRHATDTAWRRLTEPAARPVTVAELPAGADPADLIATGHEHALAHLVRDARPAAQVVWDHTLDGVDLDGNPARRLAGFRQLLPDTTRIPTGQRVDHILHLAHRLDIDPAVAATEAAAFNPNLFANRAADQLVDHCHQLARHLDTSANDQALQDLTTDVSVAAPTRRLS